MSDRIVNIKKGETGTTVHGEVSDHNGNTPDLPERHMSDIISVLLSVVIYYWSYFISEPEQFGEQSFKWLWLWHDIHFKH